MLGIVALDSLVGLFPSPVEEGIQCGPHVLADVFLKQQFQLSSNSLRCKQLKLVK